MPINDETTATAPIKTRRKRRATDASTAKARPGYYKRQVETLSAEVERLKARLRTAESKPGSSFEQSLILKASESSFRAGVETGLMLQTEK